jgi:hypothetical protein
LRGAAIVRLVGGERGEEVIGDALKIAEVARQGVFAQSGEERWVGGEGASGVLVEVGDLVEEEGVAVGLLDQARAAGGRAGEGAAFVADELGARELWVGAELAADDDGPRALAEALVQGRHGTLSAQRAATSKKFSVREPIHRLRGIEGWRRRQKYPTCVRHLQRTPRPTAETLPRQPGDAG